MFQQQVQIVISFIVLLDGLLVIACGYLAKYLKWIESGYLFEMDGTLFIGIVLFLMFVNTFCMGRAGFYSDKRPAGVLVTGMYLLVAVAVDFSILLVGLYTMKIFDISRLFFLFYAGSLFLSTLLLRLFMGYYLQTMLSRGFNARRVVIAGSDSRAAKVLEALSHQLSWGHMVSGYLKPFPWSEDDMEGPPLLGAMAEFEQILHEHSVDEVIFVLPRVGNIETYLELCDELGVAYRMVPSMYDPDDALPLTAETIQSIPTLSRAKIKINATGMLYKMFLDYVGGVVGCFFLCLMYPFVALAIKRDDPGPVMFKQPRVGQNRRVFMCYKFRTMYVDAEERKAELMKDNIMDAQMFKMENDPRITRVGAFLRKTSLDEFPQFINVLKGEMSLVGTRPPTLDEVAKYKHWHQRRMSMKPGITGLWQISGRNKITDFDEVVKLDLKYIDNWRFIDDLTILWKTVVVVLRRKGAI